MEKLRLGRITSAVGLSGEVRVYPYTDYKEKFEEIDYVLLRDEKVRIEKVRYNKNMAILKLEGMDDRSAAEKNREQDLFIFLEDAPPLPEGAYYVKDLIGLAIVDGEGQKIGTLVDIIKNSAQDLYEVEPLDGGKRFLVPAVEEFVPEVSPEKGFIRVHLIEGLRDL
ncbi:MAG: ribosome maturation factor RimM [Eubacteriales bacterium]|nr:ribosome maturation factor RimM [Eubacteriales bacterium]MDD3350168.1 ribosome maturation factor RimM [Eubacteriales bacterium]